MMYVKFGKEVNLCTTFKLLGIHVSSELKWADHVDAIVSGVPVRDLLHTLLHCYSQAGPRICLSGLALGFNCWTV